MSQAAQVGPIALVTGGCGFLGHHLVSRLLANGYAVRVLDNLSTGVNVKTGDGVEMIPASLSNQDALHYAVRGAEVVFHLACLRFEQNNDLLMAVNVSGTRQLLDACRSEGVKRFIFASEAMSLKEVSRVRAADPYHISKLMGEQYVTAYHDWYGMQTISLRFTEVFGPCQNSTYVVPRLVRIMMDNRDVIMIARPRYSRDFCYVEDAIDAIMLALKADLHGQVVNVGSGEHNSLQMLAKAIQRVVRGSFVPQMKTGKTDSHFVYTGKIEIARATNILGYKPRISFEKGIRRYCTWAAKQQRGP